MSESDPTIPIKYRDGRDKESKFIHKNCESCGIEIVYKIYIDATDAEIAELDKFCLLCREKAMDPNRKMYVCAYCSHGKFTLTQIKDPNRGVIETEVRCAKCGYNEQKLTT